MIIMSVLSVIFSLYLFSIKNITSILIDVIYFFKLSLYT